MKPIVIVEDEERQRQVLAKTLSHYKFKPISGETIAETLELLREYEGQASVVVLDMNLQHFSDYKEQARNVVGELTGAGLTKKILAASTIRRPEVIINSAYHRSDYYKEAIEAGASKYLNKGTEPDKAQLLPLIQALALKHAFQAVVQQEREIAQLAEGPANSFDLIEHFCKHKLALELDQCLAGAPFLLLWHDKASESRESTTERKLVGVSSNIGDPLPQDSDLQELYQNIFSQVSRFAIYSAGVNLQALGEKTFVFIQLARVPEAEIALGIMTPFPFPDPIGVYPFSIETLASCIIEHAATAIEMYVQRLVFRWLEKQSVSVECVRTAVGLSGNIQRELSSILGNRPVETSEEAEGILARLSELSEELANYNRTLAELLDRANSLARHKNDPIRLTDVIAQIEADYDRMGRFDKISFTIPVDCVVSGDRYYLSLAFRALVNWAFSRSDEVAPGGKQSVQIKTTVRGNWQEFDFQDNSRRLSERAREAYMSEPMSALNVAQLIVEVGCHGKLIDVTDELQGETGNQFRIRLLQS